MKIKTPMRYHLIHSRITLIWQQTKKGNDVENTEPSHMDTGSIKWHGPFEKQFEFLKSFMWNYHIDPAAPLPVMCLKVMKTYVHTKAQQPKYLSVSKRKNNVWYVFIIEHLSAIKMNKMLHATTGTGLKNITLTERNHTQETTVCVILITRHVQKRWISRDRMEVSSSPGLEGNGEWCKLYEISGRVNGNVLELEWDGGSRPLQTGYQAGNAHSRGITLLWLSRLSLQIIQLLRGAWSLRNTSQATRK